MHSLTMSFGLVPERMVWEPRRRAKDCLPVPMGRAYDEAPAGASNLSLLGPEVRVTVPGWVSRATRKIWSVIVSWPLGLPTK